MQKLRRNSKHQPVGDQTCVIKFDHQSKWGIVGIHGNLRCIGGDISSLTKVVDKTTPPAWNTSPNWKTLLYFLVIFLRKTNKPTHKLHDHCVQMVGHDTVINGHAADRVAAMSRSESSHGRASLQRRPALLWWKQSRSSECCELKGVKTQQGQKSKSGLLFSLPLLWGLRKAWWDFLNTASEKKLDFHRPADPLRAGVSQIQFQTSFLSFQRTSQLTIPLPDPSAYQDLNKS